MGLTRYVVPYAVSTDGLGIDAVADAAVGHRNDPRYGGRVSG